MIKIGNRDFIALFIALLDQRNTFSLRFLAQALQSFTPAIDSDDRHLR